MLVRIRFNKKGNASYISHLDLLRTFNRMIMRSKIDATYSQGYNPHYILNFIQPSPVGMETYDDLAELRVDGNFSLESMSDMLREASPSDIEIIGVTADDKPLFSSLSSALYEVVIETDVEINEFKRILLLNEILIEKKTKKGIKEVNIKPLIYDYNILRKEKNIIMELKSACGSVSNLNPVLLIRAFEKNIPGSSFKFYKIKRLKLFDEKGKVY